jgi:acetaldehyde dehydrogenase (acetylating)
MSAAAGRLRIAIIGSGNIGTDLLVKAVRSPLLEPAIFVGRNLHSDGMTKAVALGVPVSDRSIDALIDARDAYDLVFDATSARDAHRHWEVLEALGKTVVDMTPAKIGEMCVPAVNLAGAQGHQNLNMVTCGGQASVPLAQLVGATHDDVDYVEVVSSIASRSAGPATRANLDEYIETTEAAILRFSGARRAKAILILNPAEPCVHMQTTVFARVTEPRIAALTAAVEEMVARVQEYVPGYRLVVPPMESNGRIVITVRVEGNGDYLPRYAGNLDIINCAAIAAAEELAKARVAGEVRS